MLNDKETYAPLVLFEYDHKPGNYCLMLTDTHMVGHDELFQANGRECHGYGWTDVALGAMRAQAPDLEARIGLDPEAGMFCAYGDDLDALRKLGDIMRDAFHDTDKLAVLVASAPWEYD